MNCPLKLNSYHRYYNIFKQCLITNNYIKYYTKLKSHINGEHLYAHILLFYNFLIYLEMYFNQTFIVLISRCHLKKKTFVTV